ncbi:hypothetical protein BD311DRAFT_759353 [Dichomitus squalens]|uniref:Uncharacterized protein n=1 Tax=Dichomitus squalens TaxID=114155 RepID=A0A4Q9Q1F3_9APHY|nr:hypothetical protein BD311DRAFT_759353 [Dichomitus squalens]TBU60820.1 hypothetical protein BD310DRAFT_922134 [Dichomitus squalens]
MALTVLSAVRSAPLCPLSLRHVLPRTYLYSCSTTTSVPFRTATLSNSDAQYLIFHERRFPEHSSSPSRFPLW